MYIFGVVISVAALLIVVPLVILPSSGGSWLGSTGQLAWLQGAFILGAIGIAFGAIIALFK